MATNEDLLFAELAVKRELLTPEQVDEILELREKLGEMGLTEGVADLAVKKKMISEKEARALLTKISPKGGRQQIEGYRLVERLGRGGMGAVYKAVQVSMNRPVALKILKPSLAKSDQQTGRLRREAQLVGKLRHPNIVQGLDFGVSNGFHYFAMEYVEGESVRDLLEKRGPMKEKEALRIVREVALALEYAHGEGVVHRDVKPGNILLGKDGQVLLADYGLAKGPLEDVELTHSGVTVGTPQYISPEQARGPSDVDIRTDLYSLGATLYHMVTGKPPFTGETLAHLIQQVLYETYPPPRRLRKDLSPSVDFLIEKLMARTPRHRYQNPKELLSDLDAIEKGRSIVPAGWQGDFESLYRRRRQKRLTLATIAVLLVAGVASGFLVWRNRQLAREEFRTRAGEELTSLLSTEVVPAGYPDRIREFERFVRQYGDTPAGERVREELLPLFRARLGHVEALNEKRREVRDLERAEEYVRARRVLEEFIASKASEPTEEVEPALRQARDAMDALLARRDETVERLASTAVETLLDAEPRTALDRLEELRSRIDRQMFAVGEDRSPLEPLERLVRDLDRAVTGAEKRLGPVRTLLESEGERDYREIRERLDDARRQFEQDERVREALARLPETSRWGRELRLGFEVIEKRLRSLNVGEAERRIDFAKKLIEERRDYRAAAEALAELRERSLPGPEADLREAQEEVEGDLARLKESAEREIRAFPADLIRQLGLRRWEAAMGAIERAEAAVATYNSNEFLPLIESARAAYEATRSVERAFLDRLSGMDQLPDGLWVENARVTDLYDLEVNGRTLLFRTRDGVRRTLPAEDVALKDLIHYTGVDPAGPHLGFAVALLRLGELERSGRPRRLRDEIDRTIQSAVLTATGDREPFGPFADRVLGYVRELRERADVDVIQFEEMAAERYREIDRDRRFGRWQKVHDAIRDLLDSENLRDTDFFRKVKRELDAWLEEAKEKLPSLAFRDYYRTQRTVHLAGNEVRQRDFRERIVFGLEDESQLERFDYTKGRIDVLTEERLVLGPPPRGRDVATERTRVEHVLRFLPAVTREEEWPKHHPLSIESPFIYQEPMAVEFRARWDRPLALLLSLAGTNVIVLSNDGRMQSGRGVHIWQSEDLEDPDETVPGHLRAGWVARHPEALEGGARHHEYFQFEANRWYRVRFEKDEKVATLLVDGVEVLSRPIERYRVDTGRIVIRTWTPAKLDEISIEGTVDPSWYQSRIVSGRGER